MKRSGFKQKLTTPMKRTPLKRVSDKKVKKKKTSLTKLKTKLWEHVKNLIRSRDGNTCYTCDAEELVGSNWHTCHFIPSSTCGALLRYHPWNLKSGCYRCNINLSGNGSEFYRRLVRDKGQEYVDNLFILKQKTLKADEIFYERLTELYEAGDEESIVDYLQSLVS